MMTTVDTSLVVSYVMVGVGLLLVVTALRRRRRVSTGRV